MTLPVSLSLALYKGLATSILIKLRHRLQREYFEDIFGAEEIKLFRKDISSLMNAAAVNVPVGKKQKTAFSFCTAPNTAPKRAHKYCYIVGCSGNDLTTELIRVPNIPNKIPKDLSCSRQMTYRLKQFIRRECMDRLGSGRLSKDMDVRVCEEHWEKVIGMSSTSIDILEKDRTKTKETLHIPTFLAPRKLGQNSFESPPTSLF